MVVRAAADVLSDDNKGKPWKEFDSFTPSCPSVLP